ncbi:MAG: YajQ family cyclic di-GMP-binding protein [Gemmatimonadota bacterium]
MASTQSFDISTGADLQEVDNAVNQAMKEIGQRYDFKGTDSRVELDRTQGELRLNADTEYRLKAAYDVLVGRLVRRGVAVRNLRPGTVEPASGGRVRQTVGLMQGIPIETSREIVKLVKGMGLKKVQVAVQGDEVRVSGPSRDDLQTVMQALREQDFGIELRFGNYRG